MHKTACDSRLRCTSRSACSELYTNGALTYAHETHSHAFNKAKILYRDISAGNIILTDDGKGLLTDWELAKMMGTGGRRRPDRTVSRPAHTVLSCTHHHSLDQVTWQFMSANLLQHPGKVHAYGRSRVVSVRPRMDDFAPRSCY
jgi:serine/threonine protein kinase